MKPLKALLLAALLVAAYGPGAVFAQEEALEFTLDVNSGTVALPKVFRPNIDLSGRGFNRSSDWPQMLAAPQALDAWQRDIGFGGGMYRLQYNVWEVGQLSKDKELQERMAANYEQAIKKISDAGGIVILDIFGTPAGQGRVLDRRSAPVDLRAFKDTVKALIKDLSYKKKYNIWYEVWSAPDLDEFFLGRKQEYLNLYKAVAEAVKELKEETKVHIPLGGPSASWWFQNLDGNNIITPERSLIYELIKFCAHYRLPLDFISWHAYSTDPRADKETTTYKKAPAALIRDWLSYFNMDNNIPLLVDEWTYDSGANVLPERGERAAVSASYVPARLRHMHEAGLSSQVYFSLEDFRFNKEGVTRNTGAFWFEQDAPEYKGGAKAIFNAFRMLFLLGPQMFAAPKLNDDYVGVIPTKGKDYFSILIYNYVDPYAAMNHVSRNVAGLSDAERKLLLKAVKSAGLEKIIRQKTDTYRLNRRNKTKAMLKKAQELDEQVGRFKDRPRDIKITLKNLKGDYIYQRYVIDPSCSVDCNFVPAEDKRVSGPDPYGEKLSLNPYSVHLIVLKVKPAEAEPVVAPAQENSAGPQDGAAPAEEAASVP